MRKPVVIAIDGPAGAGKSTVAQKLAERLGLPYVDSGATYRAAALKVIDAGVSTEDEAAVGLLIDRTEIRCDAAGARPTILLDGEDVTERLRTPQVTLIAAKVSRLPSVRQKLISLQRTFARGPGVVMEGRDIGTVVFPEAGLKIFLRAAPEERARRRLKQDKADGREASLEQTANEIRLRDQLDAERKLSPLVPAPDAIQIDSTHLQADEVVEQILQFARERGLTPQR